MGYKNFIKRVHAKVDRILGFKPRSKFDLRQENLELERERSKIDLERRNEILREAIAAERHPFRNRARVIAEDFIRSTPINAILPPRLRPVEYNRSRPKYANPIILESDLNPQVPEPVQLIVGSDFRMNRFNANTKNPFELIRKAPKNPPPSSVANIIAGPSFRKPAEKKGGVSNLITPEQLQANRKKEINRLYKEMHPEQEA